MDKNHKYCVKFCEHHPSIQGVKGIGYLPYICKIDGIEYMVKQEHSKGRPFLRLKNCPLLKGENNDRA